MRKCIFFDRDGVINKRLIGDYVKNIEDFELIHSFVEFFKSIKNTNSLKIVITNQQGIGKSLMTESDLNNIHNFMQKQLLELAGHNFDDIYFCPDLAKKNSPRRKPNPGMILEAIKKWNIDPKNSWMIGDSITDVIAGKKVGVKTVLISKNTPETDKIRPDFHFRDHSELIKNMKF